MDSIKGIIPAAVDHHRRPMSFTPRVVESTPHVEETFGFDLDSGDIDGASPEPTRPRLTEVHRPRGERRDYQPEPVCQKCLDRGFLRIDVPFGHPSFGKLKKCECTLAKEKVQKQQALENMSGIVHYTRYEKADFEHFNKRAPGVKPAYYTATAYADDPDGWLVFVGPPGCGKTHLAVSIAKVCLANGESVLVQTVPDLLDNLRTTFDPKAEVVSYTSLFEDMKTAKILVLDDYGAENTTPWAVEKLFQILNYRYNMMLPTVITTNNGLDSVDARIRSRLSDKQLVTVVHMEECEDMRPQLPERSKAGK